MSLRAGPRLTYYAAILLLPIVVLWHRQDAIFSPLWYADTWFYLGYFRDLVSFKRDLFPGYYYGSRLSWILPGYLVHRLFQPEIANAVVHLAAHIVGAASLFRILRSTAGDRAAFLTVIFYSANPWVWTATGWDYIAGAAMAYLLFGMACLVSAAENPSRRWAVILAGISLAGAVFDQLFMGLFIPFVLFYYAAMLWARGIPLKRTLIQSASRLLAGFVAATVPLCVINRYWIDGNFWFWSPSFRTAGRVMGNYTWVETIWDRDRLSPWLWLFGVAAILGLLLTRQWRDAIRRRDIAGLVFSLEFLLLFAFMAVTQALGFTWLGHSYYACYLLPFAFLVIGHGLWPPAGKMWPGAYPVACAAAVVLTAASWYDPSQHPVPGEVAWLAVAGVLLAISVAFRNSKAGILWAVGGLALLTYATYDGGNSSGPLHARRDEYQRVMAARQRIEHRRNGSPILFWYDKEDPAYHEYFALNATYLAEFARINEKFPSGCPEQSGPGTMIAVLSPHPGAAEQARSALNGCLSSGRLKADIDQVFRGSEGSRPYSIALLSTRLDQSGLRPVRANFGDPPAKGALEFAGETASLPPQLWKAAPGTVQSTKADGIEVRTPRDRYAYALTYPALRVPAAGRYYFVLRYEMQTGHIAFGAFAGDDSRWLATVKAASNSSKHREAIFFVDLKQGDEVILRVANDNWYDRPSYFTVEAVSAFLATGS